jgi:hypothetical protein
MNKNELAIIHAQEKSGLNQAHLNEQQSLAASRAAKAAPYENLMLQAKQAVKNGASRLEQASRGQIQQINQDYERELNLIKQRQQAELNLLLECHQIEPLVLDWLTEVWLTKNLQRDGSQIFPYRHSYQKRTLLNKGIFKGSEEVMETLYETRNGVFPILPADAIGINRVSRTCWTAGGKLPQKDGCIWFCRVELVQQPEPGYFLISIQSNESYAAGTLDRTGGSGNITSIDLMRNLEARTPDRNPESLYLAFTQLLVRVKEVCPCTRSYDCACDCDCTHDCTSYNDGG